MRDSAGELAQSLELLRLPQLRLKRLAASRFFQQRVVGAPQSVARRGEGVHLTLRVIDYVERHPRDDRDKRDIGPFQRGVVGLEALLAFESQTLLLGEHVRDKRLQAVHQLLAASGANDFRRLVETPGAHQIGFRFQNGEPLGEHWPDGGERLCLFRIAGDEFFEIVDLFVDAPRRLVEGFGECRVSCDEIAALAALDALQEPEQPVEIAFDPETMAQQRAAAASDALTVQRHKTGRGQNNEGEDNSDDSRHSGRVRESHRTIRAGNGCAETLPRRGIKASDFPSRRRGGGTPRPTRRAPAQRSSLIAPREALVVIAA